MMNNPSTWSKQSKYEIIDLTLDKPRNFPSVKRIPRGKGKKRILTVVGGKKGKSKNILAKKVHSNIVDLTNEIDDEIQFLNHIRTVISGKVQEKKKKMSSKKASNTGKMSTFEFPEIIDIIEEPKQVIDISEDFQSTNKAELPKVKSLKKRKQAPDSTKENPVGTQPVKRKKLVSEKVQKPKVKSMTAGTKRKSMCKEISVKKLKAADQGGLQQAVSETGTSSAGNSINSSKGFTFNWQDLRCEDNVPVCRQWKDEDLVSQTTNAPAWNVKNVIQLLDQECTVPFIVRYRREKIGNLEAEKVREIQMTYENVKSLRKKVDTILKSLCKQIVEPKIVNAFLNAQSMEEVEYLYAPYKPGNKRSLAERAKKLGLEPFANELLEGRKCLRNLNISSLVNPNVEGLLTEHEVRKGIQNIIADVIAKDREILEYIHQHPWQSRTEILCSESASAKKLQKQAFVEGKRNENFKFENYYNFKGYTGSINAHQVMAINRGETQKVLTVKLVTLPAFKSQILQKCWSHFCKNRYLDPDTTQFMGTCIEDAYNRLLEPHIHRHIRCELTKKAEKESVDVFCTNLKRLLLTPPIRGQTVLGIDPGYKNGCKMAVVSCTGDVLATDTIYPLTKSKYGDDDDNKLLNMVFNFGATSIAIGNGTGCREMESHISILIKEKAFRPYEVKYCIVNESGASVYSVTKEAELDLPGMDPNLRSAASIARRIQDPLLEYVKVDPKHLGVGMYQHDVPEVMLKSALESVVVECVSFVGVDLNVCPVVLLRKISGLSAAKAKQIIEWREKNGCFVNRQQLLEVKGLGPKSYEQCAGFVKILPETSTKEIFKLSQMLQVDKKSKKKLPKASLEPNLLDTTVIHPESYAIAEKFLKELNATQDEIGKQSLVNKVKDFIGHTAVKNIAAKYDVPCERMQLIIDAFSQLMEYDIRTEFDVPLFQTGVMSMSDIAINQVLTGRVCNVTNFGAFVDIGVGQDGLIHTSKMRGKHIQLGDRVSVRVLSIDVIKKRISLEAC